jgi:hypothetical protein
VDWGLASVAGGPTPGDSRLRPASGGRFGPTLVLVRTQLERGGADDRVKLCDGRQGKAGATGDRQLRDEWFDDAGGWVGGRGVAVSGSGVAWA